MPFDPETGLPVADPPPAAVPPVGGVTVVMPPPPPPVPPAEISPQLQAWFDQEINRERERVRTEEKNKLYPQLDDLRGQVTVLSEERASRLQAEEEAQQAAAEAERLRQEAEMSAADRVQAMQTDMDRRFAQIELDRAQERALWDKETEFRSLEDYKGRRRAEEADNIIPQFMDLITGNNPEQVEASIEDMKQRSATLLAEIQGAQAVPVRQTPGLPVTGAPSVDMARMGEEGRRTFTTQELADMPMEEYQVYRQQLMGAASQQVRDRGLYG